MTGKFFEDWVVGETLETPGRTVTETDVVMFAGMTGDYNELHTNDVLMKESEFGQRIAHGLLLLSISHGLLFRTGFLENTILAFLGISSWTFHHPVFIGDTVRVRFRVENKRRSKSKPDRGIVDLALEMLNQRGIVVQSGMKTLLVRCNVQG